MDLSLKQSMRWHRPLMYFAVAMAALLVATMVGLAVDDRVLGGAPIWLKPAKFAASLMIYAVTMAWLVSLLRRGRRVAWWAGTLAAVAGLIEIVIIVGQAARGRHSHFNNATPLDSALFSIMGLTIMGLWVVTLVIGVLLSRQPLGDRATSWAIRLGVLLSLAGMALGALMTTPTAEQRASGIENVVGGHSVGVPDGGPGMPITNWSTTGGDLRVPHFVGLHAVQALPLFVLLLVILARYLPRLRDDGVRLRLVVLAGAGYAGLLALVTWQALRGQPLVNPDPATWTALGVLVAALAGGASYAVRTRGPAVPGVGHAGRLVAGSARRA